MTGDERSKLKALTDIAAIDITLDFDNVLHDILSITCETIGSHSGTIMLVDEETKELRMAASYNLGPDYIEKVYEAAKKAGVSISSSPSGIVLKTGNYYIVPNIFEEQRNRPWYHLSREHGFSAQLFTPMKRGLNVIGLLNVYMAESHQFSNDEIHFVTLAASHATSVVQNARLCTRLKKSVHELDRYQSHLEDKIKETYEKLYDSEKYLNMIIDSSLDGITVVNEHNNFEFVNRSFLEIIDWPEKEIVGQNFMKILPEDKKDLPARLWNDIRSGINTDHEIKIKTKSGEIKYLRSISNHTEMKGKSKIVCIVEDITEKKRLEQKIKEYHEKLERSYEELKESEVKYRELFENASDIMCTFDTEGYLLTMNSLGLKRLGYTREEVVGSHVSKYMAPESQNIRDESLQKIASGASFTFPVTLEVICKNGERCSLEVTERPVRVNGRITEIHGIARDVTEKKRLEEKLQESEAKYRDLFENASDIMYTFDPDGYFMTMNTIGLKTLGYTREEIIGSHVSQYVVPESLNRGIEALKKTTSGESHEFPITLVVICKNGDRRFLEITERPVRVNGRITEIHGIARDITEKKRLEEKLQESEAKYRDLFENATYGIFIHDLDGYFQTINDAMLRILGCTRDEAMGSHFSRWLTPDGLKVVQENIDRIISGEPIQLPVVQEMITITGEHRFIEIGGRQVMKGGRITGIHAIARDITEKMKLEQSLNEYHEKLEESYRDLKESEKKYRDLFENANDGIYTHDAEGYLLDMNHAGLEMFGCTKEEMIGSHFSKWLTPESLDTAGEVMKKFIWGELSEEPKILEFVGKDGKIRYGEVKARAIKSGGTVSEIHGIIRDITETRNLKLELKNSNRQLRLLWYLTVGTRGGNARALILRHLAGKPYNAHQLSKALKMDYKTTRHHLEVLLKNEVINMDEDKRIYSLSRAAEQNLRELAFFVQRR